MTIRNRLAALVTLVACTLGPGAHSLAASPPRVLVVLSSVDRLPNASVDTGNYLHEVAYPVMKLEAAGNFVDFVAPSGQPALVRGNEAYGFPSDSAKDETLRAFVDRHLEHDRLRAVRSPHELDATQYAAIVYTGSLGALIDVAADSAIAAIARDIHARGGIVAAFGHGIAGLLPLRGSDGSAWLTGRRVAVFTRAEDEAFFFDDLGWQAVLPYHIEQRVRDAGAIVQVGAAFEPHVMEDDRVLTSQNAGAAAKLSDLLVARLRGHVAPEGAAED